MYTMSFIFDFANAQETICTMTNINLYSVMGILSKQVLYCRAASNEEIFVTNKRIFPASENQTFFNYIIQIIMNGNTLHQ